MYLFYGKTAFGRAVVSRTQFLAAVSADRNGVGLFHVVPAIENQREAALDDADPSLVPFDRTGGRGQIPLRNGRDGSRPGRLHRRRQRFCGAGRRLRTMRGAIRPHARRDGEKQDETENEIRELSRTNGLSLRSRCV